MTDRPDTISLTNSMEALLGVARAAKKFKISINSDQTDADDGISVESQAEVSRDARTIWGAVRNGNIDNISALIKTKGEIILSSRGSVGESPIHSSLLYGNQHVAKWLIENYPNLIDQTYGKGIYKGENLLHIAIVNKDYDMVKFLVERSPELLKGKATGSFFQVGTPCYYGEYPLFFAACTNQRKIFKYLVSKGAELLAVDGNGNNILHLAVLRKLVGMFTYIQEYLKDEIKKDKSKEKDYSLWKHKNHAKMTPFTLAAQTGSKDMFAFLLEQSKQLEWKYGAVSSYTYCLEEVDTPFDHSATPGALQLIVENEHVELLMLPKIKGLLQKKWDRFIGGMFSQMLLLVLGYLLLFWVATILRTEDYEQFSNMFIIKTIVEVLVVAGAMYKGAREFQEMMEDGVQLYWSRTGAWFLENLLSWCFCCTILITALMRVFKSEYEDAGYIFGSLFGWSYMLFFFLGFRLTGPFVVVIWKMLTADVVRFGVIFTVFLQGFSQAFYVAFSNQGLFEFGQRVKLCFMAMLGGFEFDDYMDTKYPVLNVSLLVVYIIVVSILLLNMLIAMMGDTYANVIGEADIQWHLEWARIILSLENEMTEAERKLKKNKYWTEIDGKRHLMIQEVDEDYFLSGEEDEEPKDSVNESTE